MGTVTMDAAAVRALADRVHDGADRLDEIRWPTDASDGLTGSAVGAATAAPVARDRLVDVVAHLRAWATAARAAVAVVEEAESSSAARLGVPK